MNERATLFLARWWRDASGYQLAPSRYGVSNDILRADLAPDGRLSLSTMPFENSDFEWHREIKEGEATENFVWLRGNSATGGTEFAPKIETFEPLKVPGLHRLFAELDGPDAILGFANSYGFLGYRTWHLSWERCPYSEGPSEGNIDVPMTGWASEEGDSDFWFFGETVFNWVEEISQMRFLLELWDAYRSKASTAELKRFIGVKGDRVMTSTEIWAKRCQLEFSIPEYSICISPEQDLREGSRAVIRMALTEKLDENTEPWFDIAPGSPVNLFPRNLLGALYIHFLREVIGRTDPLARCGGCGKFFVQRHAGRMYCSAACKQKAYRESLKKRGETNG